MSQIVIGMSAKEAKFTKANTIRRATTSYDSTLTINIAQTAAAKLNALKH